MFDVLVNFGLFVFYLFFYLLVSYIIHLYYDDCIYVYEAGDISWLLNVFLVVIIGLYHFLRWQDLRKDF